MPNPIINSLDPLDPNWENYRRLWRPIFWNYREPYDDFVQILYGPRGGGKTITATALNIIDGMVRGIPVVSNVPISLNVVNTKGRYYNLQSIPFNVDAFAEGNDSLYDKRLFIDEGNYELDRLRSTSTKNLALTDILQQARKFRMVVTFATINWAWLDPRLTGSLVDILIECNDIHYTAWGKRKGLRKGERIIWTVFDKSGKLTGHRNVRVMKTTFYARSFWGTFNTWNYISPMDARRKLKSQLRKVITGEDGKQYDREEWLKQKRMEIFKLAKEYPEWDARDLWDRLGVKDDHHLKIILGAELSNMGAVRDKAWDGTVSYQMGGILVPVQSH